MCIRDRAANARLGLDCGSRAGGGIIGRYIVYGKRKGALYACLLYTSDAADERSSVDLGGRRIIKKKTLTKIAGRAATLTHRKCIEDDREINE